MNATHEAISIALQADIPIIYWDTPGTGKSKFIDSLFRALHYENETVNANTKEPSDIGGIPIVVGKDCFLAAPGFVKRAADRAAKGEKTGIFFDDLSCATPVMQGALLAVILERHAADVKLDKCYVRMIAAANPIDCASGGFDFTPALANRFVHISGKFDAQEWAEGALGGFPDPVVRLLPENWKQDFLPAARAEVASYIHTNLAMANPPLPVDEVARGGAFPTPRSWEWAWTLLAAARSVGYGIEHQVTGLLLSGAIGDGAAIGFLTYSRELDLPDPETLLEKPELLNETRGDRLYAILGSVVAAIISKPEPKRWVRAWDVLARACDLNNADVGAAAARSLMKARPPRATIDAAAKSMGKFKPVLQAANLWLA
jgi:hypothetical protein